MKLAQLKHMVYENMVDSHQTVSQEYAVYLDMNQQKSYAEKFFEILKLNWKYRICRQSVDDNLDRLVMPEQKAERHMSVSELVEFLSKYDVISFDIFDTLIFRAVEKPTDVFRLLEAHWNLIGFAKQREMAEQRARQGGHEIKLSDIYGILSAELAIDKENGMEYEFSVEKAVCFANPYVHAVYKQLIKRGKIIVAVSDMYLPNRKVKELLDCCGYSDISGVYVSCDYKVGKGTGKLQKIVQSQLGVKHTYIHMGDNMQSDILGSKKAGWDTFYYPNIQKIGYKYRRKEMTSLASAFYKGLVNSRLHSGLPYGNAYYEIGYVYGGILAMGYCQYIDRLVKERNINQILFVARDGYILNEIYQKLFSSVDCAYVPFSRFASYQIAMERSWRGFLQNVVRPRVDISPSESLEQVMRICDMKWLCGYFEQYGLETGQKFDVNVYRTIEHIFEEHMQEITGNYRQQAEAAEKYFRNIIGSHKNICIVDIGWQGTSIECLNYFLNQKCCMDIKLCGALIGSCNNDAAEIMQNTKLIHSYLFSREKNRDNMYKHMGKQEDLNYRNLLVEILFTEDKPSFLTFNRDANGQILFEYSAPEQNGAVIHEIQSGMMEFCSDFSKYSMKFPGWLEFSGMEAYLPLNGLAEARKYCKKILEDYEINAQSGRFENEQKKVFGQII